MNSARKVTALFTADEATETRLPQTLRPRAQPGPSTGAPVKELAYALSCCFSPMDNELHTYLGISRFCLYL